MEDNLSSGNYCGVDNITKLMKWIERINKYFEDRAKINLFIAIKKFDIESIKQILNKYPDLIHSKGKFDNTPLHTASFFANLEAVELLLAKGADVNARNEDGYTPLHQTVDTYYITEYNSEIIESLLKNGAQIDAQDRDGDTPLHKARRNENSEFIALLLINKADATVKNNINKIALNISFSFLKTLDIEVFKLLYIRSEGNIENSAYDHEFYHKSKLKQIINLALKLKPLMQIIKNLFVRDETENLLKQSKANISIDLPKFKSFSTEEDDSIYREFVQYYEMPIKYFQYLLVEKMSKAEPKELQNLPMVIHNNMIALQNKNNEQLSDLNLFKDSAGNAITFRQHIYKNSFLDKMCANNQQEEKDYRMISLKHIAIIKLIKMLREKKIDEQAISSKIPEDLWFEITNLEKLVYHVGDIQMDVTED